MERETKPLSYEKFGNIEFKERNFEIIRSCALCLYPEVKQLRRIFIIQVSQVGELIEVKEVITPYSRSGS